MAAKRKRSLRGLGASAEEHSKEAVYVARDAQDRLIAARERAEKGMCGRALIAFRVGSTLLGQAEAEKRYGGNDIDILPHTESLAATRALEAHCLVGKGLSGLAGRRPSRRRK